MKCMDSNNFIINTETLARVFGVSERQVQRFVRAGVIEPCNNGQKPYQFDLRIVVPQYKEFLWTGIPLSEWAPDT